MFSSRTVRTRAFTLLELIVVIVVLGILAAIAIPTFSMVIEKSQDRTAEASLSSFAHEVQAIAALDQAGLTRAAFDAASPDLEGFAGGTGVLAAASSVEVLYSPDGGEVAASQGSKDSKVVLSYALGKDELAGKAGLAGVSASGNCVGVRFDASVVTVVLMPGSLADCTGQSALLGEAVSGGTVDVPVGGADGGESGTATLAAPLNLVGSAKDGMATLEWDSSDGVESYDVFRGTSDTAEVTVSASPVQLPLALGAQADFRVVARTGDQVSPAAKVTVLSVPAAPASVSASLSGLTASVSWEPVPAVSTYRLVKDGVVVALLSETSKDVTLVPGETASFTVAAANASGFGAPSAPSNAVTAAPAAPGVVAVAAGPNVSVTWGPSDGATSYEVFRNGVSIKKVSASDTRSVSDPSLLAGTYTYTVVASNVGGSSQAGSASVTVLGYDQVVTGTSSLAAYWRLGEQSGSTVSDSSGHGHTGSSTAGFGAGGAVLGPDTAAGFNGSWTGVSVPDSADLRLQGAWTMEVWMMPASVSALTQDYVLFKGALAVGPQTNNYALIYGYTPGKVELYRQGGDGSDIRTGSMMTIPAAMVYTHVVYTYDGTTFRGYINGVEQFSKPLPGLVFNSGPNPVGLGSIPGSANGDVSHFDGQLDEVALYNRALSPAEVSLHAAYRK